MKRLLCVASKQCTGFHQYLVGTLQMQGGLPFGAETIMGKLIGCWTALSTNSIEGAAPHYIGWNLNSSVHVRNRLHTAVDTLF